MEFRRARIRASSAIPDDPPAAVRRAIDAAGAAYDRLEAAGHRLPFHLSPDTGELTVLYSTFRARP